MVLKKAVTAALITSIVAVGIFYQYHYDLKKRHYRALIEQYAPEYDQRVLTDSLVDVYTQWVINGAGQGRKRKAFLDEKFESRSGQGTSG